ncbi:hypothetical protein C8J57DRAFT_1527054 [Mycena rebaudengoi]|nr:hypothetical protein C8J57DRAFT_1527054 [Mycena rebaudengoi]
MFQLLLRAPATTLSTFRWLWPHPSAPNLALASPSQPRHLFQGPFVTKSLFTSRLLVNEKSSTPSKHPPDSTSTTSTTSPNAAVVHITSLSPVLTSAVCCPLCHSLFLDVAPRSPSTIAY